MAEHVEIILTQDVPHLGSLGDQKQVKLGYARNYLLPKGLGLVVSKNNLFRFASIKKNVLKQREQQKLQVTKQASALQGKALSFLLKTHDGGKLYGSVSALEIGKKLEEMVGFPIDRKHILLEEPIKEVGTYSIVIQWDSDISATVSVDVQAESRK